MLSCEIIFLLFDNNSPVRTGFGELSCVHALIVLYKKWDNGVCSVLLMGDEPPSGNYSLA